jgi:MoaA/NifB/PqqE/SkfB family radical SAM enzyme
MNKLIAIEHNNPNHLIITLQLTTVCTYTCRYCPESLHTGKSQDFNLVELREFLDRFVDREVALTITGGEPTLHTQLEDVLLLAKSLGIKTLVDTNFVRTARFYKGIKTLVDVWNITLHPTQHVFDIEKINILTDSSYVVVYIIMDPDCWDTSLDWWNQCTKLDNVKVIPLRALSDWSGASCKVEYTPEQEQWIYNTKSALNLTEARYRELSQTHQWMINTDSTAIYNDHTEMLDAYMLQKQGLNNFYNWKCYAGKENILIHSNGSASWANCGIKRYNHYLDITPEKINKPILCDRLQCYCVTDVRSTKYAIKVV